ncbi:Beta-lactamase hcpA precursor [Psychrobacter phenylpyruvicus]|uniref:Beta-lactamase hcpA n=3 Tax=Psychrobacter phenylpyruvicus TaxID=29432 RepID=A0A379LP60_9GAMM|nr:Beta-lactamase hcpA precursor [Psychrobacter phenylpyruvicus]
MGQMVDRNNSKAAKWFEKAANQGMAEAQREIGLIYYYGSGVNQDDALAKDWLKKSCENGLKIGCEDYNYLYSSGSN